MNAKFFFLSGLFFAVIALAPMQGYSQYAGGFSKPYYLGLSASFGAEVLDLSSDLAAINGMRLVAEGSDVGIVFGGRLVRTRLAAGFYYSTSAVPHTTDMVKFDFNSSFYPMQLIERRSRRIEPFTSLGVNRGIVKFHGFYDNPDQIRNYSLSIEPYLGKSVIMSLEAGLGAEISLLESKDFVKLLVEAKGYQAFGTTSSELFSSTGFSNHIALNVGLSFGLSRFGAQSNYKYR
jgi:hypothetical protein